MTDGDLLVFGCAVSFIALAGAYVCIRERFTRQGREEARATRRVAAPRRRLRKIA